MKQLRLGLGLSILGFFVSCSASLPSAKTAQSVATSYFQSYGNKYKTSPFAGKNLAKVAINQIEPVSDKHVQVDALTNFKDGRTSRVLIKMENKLPGGWRVESWEFLDGQ